MSVEKERWAESFGTGCLSASQMGCALGLRGRISDFIHYERELKHTQLAFQGNEFTSHGVRIEPIARAVYEYYTGNTVLDGGFHVHPVHTFLGCSPDGIIIDNDQTIGILEIKSPFHALYAPGKPENMSNGIPKSYMCQMQCQMQITNSPYCDFFVYLHTTRDRVAWRVKRSDAWWSWAISKLQLVSRAIASSKVPEALQSRTFRFPDFDFECIETELLITPRENRHVYGDPKIPNPRAYALREGEECYIYAHELNVRKQSLAGVSKSKEGFYIVSSQFHRKCLVRVKEEGNEYDPFFTVFDSDSECLYRVLGKNVYPIQGKSEIALSENRDGSPPKKRSLLAQNAPGDNLCEPAIRPILLSVRDIGEYYGSLDANASVHIIEGDIPESHRFSVSKLVERILDRFSDCTYSTFEQFMKCLSIESDYSDSLPTDDSTQSETKELHILRSNCIDGIVQFILILGESFQTWQEFTLPSEWMIPTLVLPASTQNLSQDATNEFSKNYPSNVILWGEGCLRQRCRVITNYWG